MDFITVDFSAPTKELAQWLDPEHFDAQLLNVPSSVLLVAKTPDKPIMYLLAQTVKLMGPLAINPEATKHELAVAIRELIVCTRLIAQQNGIANILTLTEAEPVKNIVQKLGFSKIPDDVFISPSNNGV